MNSFNKIFQKLFSYSSKHLAIFIILIVMSIFAVRMTAVKVYSESDDVLYRQQGILGFSTEGLTFDKPVNLQFEINSNSKTQNQTDEENNTIKVTINSVYITPTPTPTPMPLPKIDPTNSDVWLNLANCEAGQRWNADTGNGYYGAFQFTQGAWESVGGTGKPSDASKDEQITRAQMLQKTRGWGAWGICAYRLGLR